VALEAADAASGNVAAALRGLGSCSCSVLERCSSVAVARKQRLQRPGALQEPWRGQEAAVAASRSVAVSLHWHGSLNDREVKNIAVETRIEMVRPQERKEDNKKGEQERHEYS
jgi:hypothetical protein